LKWGAVAAVHVEGHDGHEAAVDKAIACRVGQPFDRETVRADVERLWALGVFADIAVHAKTSPKGLEITYRLDPRPMTAKVYLRGNQSLPQHVLDDAIQLREGEPFEARLLGWSALGLVEAYREAGYRFVEVRPHALDRDDERHVCLEVDQGPKVTIAQWSFSGVRRLDEPELRALIDTQDGRVNTTGGVYRPDLWAQDAYRLLAHYYDRGFVAVQIGEPKLSSSQDRTRLTVVIPVEEGKPYRVGTVKVSGAAMIPGRGYQGVVQTQTGEPFSRSKVAEDIARLRELHESGSGWSPGVEITPLTVVDADRAVVDIDFRVE
jgi:outer membrane protein insertion porin family